MKTTVSILSCLLFSTLTNAQVIFQRTIDGGLNEYGYDVIQTYDSGYAFAGATQNTGNAWSDAYLVRTDANGDTLWTRTYGGNDVDAAMAIQQTHDSGFVIAGYTKDFLGLAYDAYLIRTDKNGDTLWTRRYGSFASFDDEVVYSVCQTRDGGFILSGSSASIGGPALGYGYVIRVESNGRVMWSKAFGGGSWQESINDVIQLQDGSFICAGSTTRANDQDLSIIKLDSLGSIIGAETFGGLADDVANSIRQTNDGGFIIAGYSESFSTSTGHDVYLIRTNANGGAIWSRTFGGYASDEANAVRPTSDGGFILLGITNSFTVDTTNVYLIKTDSNGDTLWTRKFGGAGVDYGTSVNETADNGYVISAFSSSFNAVGDKDLYMIKTDVNGNSRCNEESTNTTIVNPHSQAVAIVFQPINYGVQDSTATMVSSKGAMTHLICGSLIGVDKMDESHLELFPNPSNGEFTIRMSEYTEGRLEIFSSLGKCILKKDISQTNEIKFQLTDVSRGIYFVRFNSKDKLINKKIIID